MLEKLINSTIVNIFDWHFQDCFEFEMEAAERKIEFYLVNLKQMTVPALKLNPNTNSNSNNMRINSAFWNLFCPRTKTMLWNWKYEFESYTFKFSQYNI